MHREIERRTLMSGVENQILTCLRKREGAIATEIARQIGVSKEFAQSVMDDLAKEGRIVKSGSGVYAVSQSEKRRWERYRRLEERRRPFLRW